MSEEAKTEIRNLLNTIGALVEIAEYLRNQLVEKGFTRKEAFVICKEFIIRQMTSSNAKSEGSEP